MATPSLQDYKSFLVSYGGGYLRNTRWESERTCDYCTGIPGNPGFPTCYRCGNIYSYSKETSDLRGFISYGWDRSQSATVMYGYKDAVPNRQAQRLVKVLLFYALHEHLRCAEEPGFGAPDTWAVVPSLRDRGHPQVLHAMVESLLTTMPEASLSKSDDVKDPRSFRPENFSAAEQLSGQHVLLIDDTWAGGGHAESATAALKRAGAGRVTLLILARWLDPSRGDTASFIRHELTEDFDPDVCPFNRCGGDV